MLRHRAGNRRYLVVVAALPLLLVAACSSSPTADPPTSPATAAPRSAPTSAPAAPLPDDPADTPGHFRVYWTTACAPPETAVDITTCRIAVGAARTAPDGTTDYPRTALDALLAGPDPIERAAGQSTNLRDVVEVNRFEVTADGVAKVDFNRYFETAKTRPQVAQVVYTLTQFGEVHAVEITVDGTSNGAVAVGPLTRADVAELTPDVLVESPTLGAPVPNRFRLAGSATSPDGRVRWVVRDAAGVTLAEGTVPIIADVGARGPFGTAVALAGRPGAPATPVAAGPVAVVAAPTTPGPPGAPVAGETTVVVSVVPGP